MDIHNPVNYDTSILHGAADRDEVTGALSIPIYNASTFHQKDISVRQEFDYGRSGNPTRKALEETLAGLESGHSAYAFSSGMSAIHAAITAFVKAGDHIVVTRDIYGGSYRFLTGFLSKFGVTHTFVDTTDPKNALAAIQPNTKILFLESPSNPLLKITDIVAHVKIAKDHDLVSMIDNTFLSPYFLRPLELGIDISIHSATKFLGGHSDLIAGAVIAKTKDLASSVHYVQNTCGAVLSPQDSWLLLRGIKTLAARMTHQQKTALTVAAWLQKQSWVKSVFFPGLQTHPGHNILTGQAHGFGCVLSFETDTTERLNTLVKNVKILTVAVSLGGVESILSFPAKMSHAAMPASTRAQLGISDTLLRLSIGLENADDIIADLDNSAKPS